VKLRIFGVPELTTWRERESGAESRRAGRPALAEIKAAIRRRNARWPALTP